MTYQTKSQDRCGAVPAGVFVQMCLRRELRNEPPEIVAALSQTHRHIIDCQGCKTAYAHEFHAHRSGPNYEFLRNRYRRNLQHLSSVPRE